VVTGGMVASTRQAHTRDGRPFIIATLEDQVGNVEVTVWPKLYENTQELWQRGNILIVKGQIRTKEGGAQLSCQEVQPYHPAKQENKEPLAQNQRHLTININQTNDAEKDVERLQKVIDILKSYAGEDKVSLRIANEDETTSLEMPNIRINYCPELASELVGILGEGNLRLEP